MVTVADGEFEVGSDLWWAARRRVLRDEFPRHVAIARTALAAVAAGDIGAIHAASQAMNRAVRLTLEYRLDLVDVA